MDIQEFVLIRFIDWLCLWNMLSSAIFGRNFRISMKIPIWGVCNILIHCVAIQCVRNTPTKDFLSVSPHEHKQESGSAPERRVPAIATEAGSDRRGSVPELSPTYAPPFLRVLNHYFLTTNC